jgi:hypothetical protein
LEAVTFVKWFHFSPIENGSYMAHTIQASTFSFRLSKAHNILYVVTAIESMWVAELATQQLCIGLARMLVTGPTFLAI